MVHGDSRPREDGVIPIFCVWKITRTISVYDFARSHSSKMALEDQPPFEDECVLAALDYSSEDEECGADGEDEDYGMRMAHALPVKEQSLSDDPSSSPTNRRSPPAPLLVGDNVVVSNENTHGHGSGLGSKMDRSTRRDQHRSSPILVAKTDPTYRVEIFHHSELSVAGFRRLAGRTRNPVVIKGLMEGQMGLMEAEFGGAIRFLETVLDKNMEVGVRGRGEMSLGDFFRVFWEHEHAMTGEEESGNWSSNEDEELMLMCKETTSAGRRADEEEGTEASTPPSRSRSSSRSRGPMGSAAKSDSSPDVLDTDEVLRAASDSLVTSGATRGDGVAPRCAGSHEGISAEKVPVPPEADTTAQKDPPPPYLADLSVAAHFPELFYHRFVQIPPYFRHCFQHRTRKQLSTAYDTPALFVGGRASWSPLHQDQLCSHFWMCLWEGCKRWVCFHPDDASLIPGAEWEEEGQIFRFRQTVRELFGGSGRSEEETEGDGGAAGESQPRQEGDENGGGREESEGEDINEAKRQFRLQGAGNVPSGKDVGPSTTGKTMTSFEPHAHVELEPPKLSLSHNKNGGRTARSELRMLDFDITPGDVLYAASCIRALRTDCFSRSEKSRIRRPKGLTTTTAQSGVQPWMQMQLQLMFL